MEEKLIKHIFGLCNHKDINIKRCAVSIIGNLTFSDFKVEVSEIIPIVDAVLGCTPCVVFSTLAHIACSRIEDNYIHNS